MKKLMIAAAIVACAACANAAYYTWGNASYSIDNWSGSAAVDPDLDAPMYKGGTMFLYLGTIGYTEGDGFDIGTATLLTYATYDADNYIYGNGGTEGYSTGTVNKMGGEDYTLVLVNNGAYTSLSGVKDGDYFVLRTGTSGSDYDADLSDNVANFLDTDAITSSNWTQYSAVPEPTSGLLMLVGVAGLALRRRRA